MKIDKSIVTLETAMELEKAGWDSPCSFSYKTHLHPSSGEIFGYHLVRSDDGVDYDREHDAPNVSEMIEALHKMANEIAIGYDDSGCFWHVAIGNKGTGYMTPGIGERFSGNELPDEEDDLVGTLAHAWLFFKQQRAVGR